MNRVPHPTVRLAAPLMALLLVVPLALPLVAHAATTGAGYEHMSDIRDMDMSGDMPCPPRGEEISSCCMQTGVVTSTPAVPNRQVALVLPTLDGLHAGALNAHRADSAGRLAGRTDDALRRAASRPPLHILNASFLL